MLALWIVVAVLAGVAAGWYGHQWYATEEEPEPVIPPGNSPSTGTAILLNADGVEVSRRALRGSTRAFQKYHGRQATEQFVYIGQVDGHAVFQVKR